MRKYKFKAVAAIFLLSVGWVVVNAILEVRRELADVMRYDAAFKISHGIRFYSSDSRLLPPAFQIDTKTGSKTSWRVLLELYYDNFIRKHDASLAWNASKNLQVASDFGWIPYCPREAITKSSEGVPHTMFAVISGDNTLFVEDQCFSLDEITDGRENTLVVVQILNSDIPWSEPRDLEMSQLDRLHHYLSSSESQENDLIGFEGQYLLFTDFEIFQVLRPMQIDDFKALITPKSGETITRDSLVEKGFLSPRGGKRAEEEKEPL